MANTASTMGMLLILAVTYLQYASGMILPKNSLENIYHGRTEFQDSADVNHEPMIIPDCVVFVKQIAPALSFIQNEYERPRINEFNCCQMYFSAIVGCTFSSGNVPPQISKLNLKEQSLNGFIPSHISKLTGLTKLNLSKNRLRGRLPTELGLLTKLENLAINENRIMGVLPKELENLKSLKTFRLSHNLFAGDLETFHFSELTNLIELALAYNLFTGPIPRSIGLLSQLRRLDLEHNNLSNSIPSQLGNLSMLSELSIGQNYLSGTLPSDIGKLRFLTYLNLKENSLEGVIPSNFGALTNLRTLHLDNNDFSGIVPDALSSKFHEGRLILTIHGNDDLSLGASNSIKGVLRSKSKVLEKNMAESCAICLDELKKGDVVSGGKRCEHEFHLDCLSRWLDASSKKSCPMCRASIGDSESEIGEERGRRVRVPGGVDMERTLSIHGIIPGPGWGGI